MYSSQPESEQTSTFAATTTTKVKAASEREVISHFRIDVKEEESFGSVGEGKCDQSKSMGW